MTDKWKCTGEVRWSVRNEQGTYHSRDGSTYLVWEEVPVLQQRWIDPVMYDPKYPRTTAYEEWRDVPTVD